MNKAASNSFFCFVFYKFPVRVFVDVFSKKQKQKNPVDRFNVFKFWRSFVPVESQRVQTSDAVLKHFLFIFIMKSVNIETRSVQWKG